MLRKFLLALLVRNSLRASLGLHISLQDNTFLCFLFCHNPPAADRTWGQNQGPRFPVNSDYHCAWWGCRGFLSFLRIFVFYDFFLLWVYIAWKKNKLTNFFKILLPCCRYQQYSYYSSWIIVSFSKSKNSRADFLNLKHILFLFLNKCKFVLICVLRMPQVPWYSCLH